ncbi:hypothetical protein [Micromonospora psammae]|uniref:hypothetical protein n=1 Tax=Micromonospora sp. CPCC 205556 TaxID=3122398 RepID=UPI002FEEA81B
MPEPQPGTDRPADGSSTPVPGRDQEPTVTDEPTDSPAGPPPDRPDQDGGSSAPAGTATTHDGDRDLPAPTDDPVGDVPAPTEGHAGDGTGGAPTPPATAGDGSPDAAAPPPSPATSPPVTPARGAAAVPAPDRPDPTRVQTRPDPTRVEARPDATRVETPEPPAPRWSGSAAVPPPPPRKRAWGESAEPTPAPPPLPVGPPEHQVPVDPWEGVDTTGWDLHPADLPALPPTRPYETPPPTRPYEAPPPAHPYPAPPADPYPAPPVAHPYPPPPVAHPYPAPPVAARPVSPPPLSPPPPPPPPVRPKRAPKQRRARPEPVAPPPGWQAPKGYVPVPVRRRRRWPWVLLLTLACCCGCPAWFGQPMWEQYPARAALPGQVADLTLREDTRSKATVKELEADVREANLLAEDTFAGVYTTTDGKRVTVFGDTGFRFRPEADADDALARLKETYQLGEAQPVETRVRGRYERCAVGSSAGSDVVVCTSVDHGSSATAVFTRLSVDDSARLLATLREQIITPGKA